MKWKVSYIISVKHGHCWANVLEDNLLMRVWTFTGENQGQPHVGEASSLSVGLLNIHGNNPQKTNPASLESSTLQIATNMRSVSLQLNLFGRSVPVHSSVWFISATKLLTLCLIPVPSQQKTVGFVVFVDACVCVRSLCV